MGLLAPKTSRKHNFKVSALAGEKKIQGRDLTVAAVWSLLGLEQRLGQLQLSERRAHYIHS